MTQVKCGSVNGLNEAVSSIFSVTLKYEHVNTRPKHSMYPAGKDFYLMGILRLDQIYFLNFNKLCC